MIEKEFSDHEDEDEELFQIKGKRKHDDVDDEEDQEEQNEEIEEEEDEDDDEEDISTKPPAKK
jgi:hypothetical protein